MSTTRRWGIGAGLAAVVILAAGWFLLVKPQKAKVNDLHAQTAAQQVTNQTLVTKITALEAAAKNNAQEQRILDKIATQIPDTAQEPALIRALSQAAKGSGVDLSEITPSAAAALSGSSTTTETLGATGSGGELYSLPLQLTVTGAYANVESFFSALEHLPRAFRVSSFSFAPAGTGPNVHAPANAISATIQTAVYYSTPSTTTAAAAPETSAAPTDGATNPAAPAADAASNAAGETS
ncbi:MAG TPA: type 4a pilus biogenesis protein PilO [Mycobacteriales bacterium]|nr:type 4a pilus biogenesis protein PilO [Mycobacteriales bacterium]